MRTFLTSDLFFGRSSLAKDRGFDSVEAMDDALVERWNATVGENDAVCVLGNFSWDPVAGESVLPFLNGNVSFMLATYDSHVPALSLVRSGVHKVVPNGPWMLRSEQANIALLPWPMEDWPGREEGVVHVHGGAVGTDLRRVPRRFSVNCEMWAMRPVDTDALVEFAEGYETTADGVPDEGSDNETQAVKPARNSRTDDGDDEGGGD